ncbi:MAG: hypothetical protein ACI35O_01910 [Bacillaceae bacterium]
MLDYVNHDEDKETEFPSVLVGVSVRFEKISNNEGNKSTFSLPLSINEHGF